MFGKGERKLFHSWKFDMKEREAVAYHSPSVKDRLNDKWSIAAICGLKIINSHFPSELEFKIIYATL